jgi:mevalonate kinase
MISVSCPGKIMLAGEYAVLEGGRALAHTINARMNLTFQLLSDGPTILYSELWPSGIPYPSSSPELAIQTLTYFEEQFGKTPPLQININSELEIKHGVGSSSALRLCLIVGLARFTQNNIDQNELLKAAYKDQKRIQTMASGYDILTQAAGGLVCMSMSESTWPKTYFKATSPHLERVRIFVGGKGAPTKLTALSTSEWLAQHIKADHLQMRSEDLVEAWLHNDFLNLLEKIDLHRELFRGSPSFLYYLDDALSPYYDKKTWTWKTTGAGGEDAILLIGDPPATALNILSQLGWYPSQYYFSDLGLTYDH